MKARPARLDPADPRLQAFRPGELSAETKAQIEAQREFYAHRRQMKEAGERRLVERRVGPFDRRVTDRREARKYLENPEPPTGFGDDLAPMVRARLLSEP